MFRTTRAAVGALASAALAFGLAACSTDEETGPTLEELQSQAAAGPSGTTTPEPTPSEATTPEDKAVAAAQAALREYYRVENAAVQDPTGFRKKDFERVAISGAILDLENERLAYAKQKYHQTGTIDIASSEVIEVKLANDVEKNKVPTVRLEVCYDISGADVLNEKGESVVPKDLPQRGVDVFGISNYEYPDGPWLVAYVDRKDGQTC